MVEKPVILVTGGAGYIGSHVCQEVANQGFVPVAYDNLSAGHAWAVKWGPLELGDIQDIPKLRMVFDKYKPKAVVHLAAHAYVGESVENPLKYYKNNVAGTLALLEIMLQVGIKNIVFSSSCATYGIPEKMPISEQQNQKPINPYGASKLFVERILIDFVNAYGFKAVCLRYFNAAGADPQGQIGEIHNPETHIIPIVCNVALGNIDFVSVFGNDYNTPDGTCIRDYTHVSDLATAHVKAINLMKNPGFSFEAFNLGSGRGYSVLDIIRAVEKASLKKVQIRFSEKRAGDPPVLISDIRKAQSVLEWTPQFAKIDEIVEHAWNFMINSNDSDKGVGF